MPDDNVLLSIITVGLDEHEIANTLNPLGSLISCSSVESIVVTPSPADSLKNLLPKSKLIVDARCGVYCAMNEGLRFSSGYYVWFLNAGDQSLLDATSIQSLFKNLQQRLNTCSACKLPLIFFGSSFAILNNSFGFGKLLLKLSLLTLGMSVSHQNILFVRSCHKPFSKRYHYSCDFEILSDLVLRSKCDVLFASPIPIAKLSAGGISDSNRISVFRERYTILRKIAHSYLAPIIVIGFLARSFRELVASKIKSIVVLR